MCTWYSDSDTHQGSVLATVLGVWVLFLNFVQKSFPLPVFVGNLLSAPTMCLEIDRVEIKSSLASS